MKKVHTKEAAEATLRELPSVLGAFVREDINGHPREVHLLVAAGPNPADLARDVRGLLEDRLGVPVDQRVISIAQLAERPAEPRPADVIPGAAPVVEEAWRQEPSPRQAVPPARVLPVPEPRVTGNGTAPVAAAEPRLVYLGTESSSRGGRVQVRVRISWLGDEFVGVAEELEGAQGRVRAAAAAALGAATEACRGAVRLELDAAGTVRALNREYAVVSARAVSSRLGRRPIDLAGAHAVDIGVEAASALAALQASNRVVVLGLRD
ncbi:MAG TPA: hypothetical protein VF188_10010 [Longimicrobiales bacterium]